MITLRPYRPDDSPALLALFRDTVRRVNTRDYSSEQIRAWASEEIDTSQWTARFEGRFVVVAEEAHQPVGFTDGGGRAPRSREASEPRDAVHMDGGNGIGRKSRGMQVQ